MLIGTYTYTYTYTCMRACVRACMRVCVCAWLALSVKLDVPMRGYQCVWSHCSHIGYADPDNNY